jgi:hypothetical protein
MAKIDFVEEIDFVEDKPENKKIDLTPSGLINNISGAAASAIMAPYTAIKEGVNPIEATKKNWEKVQEAQKTNPHPYMDAVTDLAGYMLLPQANLFKGAGLLAKVGNSALTGGYQGALTGGLESLKNQGDLSGAGSGAGIGAGANVGIPLALKGAVKTLQLLPASGGVIAKAVGRIQPETLKRAVQPDSIALDLTKPEAQSLLMNTTERVQNSYQNLLNKQAKNVETAIENLNELDDGVDALTLMSDINDTFNQYGGKKINPARNMTGKLENDLYELISKGADKQGNLAPIDLQKAKEQIGKMVKWDDATAANYYNPILEQVYGKYNSRLSQLSPELAEANAAYSQLNDFMKNEGVRKILRQGDNIDVASSALKNYDNTVTKGNTNRNIQDLENLLVKAGEKPFLRDIDDVNAAMDLLNARATGDSWLANIATQTTRPVLKTIRKLNQLGIPQAIQKATDKAKSLQRILPPAAVMSTSPMLYGGVEYNDYR